VLFMRKSRSIPDIFANTEMASPENARYHGAKRPSLSLGVYCLPNASVAWIPSA